MPVYRPRRQPSDRERMVVHWLIAQGMYSLLLLIRYAMSPCRNKPRIAVRQRDEACSSRASTPSLHGHRCQSTFSMGPSCSLRNTCSHDTVGWLLEEPCIDSIGSASLSLRRG